MIGFECKPVLSGQHSKFTIFSVALQSHMAIMFNVLYDTVRTPLHNYV